MAGNTQKKSEAIALLTAKDYVNNICESDISTVDGIQKNSEWARIILRSYARNISTLAKKTNIYKDVSAGSGRTDILLS